ncbi:pentapeptide repeat-containing protein [Marinobacter sp. HL-58]|uniref:pentapeptide repeat-containing protein n=1 Tax=Marinobacter sp. HL-58 TaxID=1479237 RepID=UPI00068BFD00|nr:pentapeptide repeat-containing protein [Marinobacter sp. HL-58]KPP97166.1 MAG: hypothetical protein HLUCCO03_09750 [Marinobacter sp. HL-58]
MEGFLEFLSDDLLANVISLVSISVPVILFLLYRFKKTVAKEQVAIIGNHFRSIVDQISSGSTDSRVAAAIQLRRFLNSTTEFGVNKMPYAKDCLEVTSAFLKIMPTSNLQKILADNLRYVPNEFLIEADLQRVNLSKAYISDKKKFLDFSRADFFQANLSGASLREVCLENAQFYEANLSGATLRDTNLRGANFQSSAIFNTDFRGADLDGANFSNSKIFNANFKDAINIDKAKFDGCIGQGNTFPAGYESEFDCWNSESAESKKVFVSRPGILDLRQKNISDIVKYKLVSDGVDVVELGRGEYESANVITKLNEMIGGCSGVIVFGFRSILIRDGEYRMGTDDHRVIESAFVSTPWNQIEAGIGIAQGKQTLLIHDAEISDGLFDPMVQDSLIQRAELQPDMKETSKAVSDWIRIISPK